jgi:DNA-binding transcriptional ArsR family regulator
MISGCADRLLRHRRESDRGAADPHDQHGTDRRHHHPGDDEGRPRTEQAPGGATERHRAERASSDHPVHGGEHAPARAVRRPLQKQRLTSTLTTPLQTPRAAHATAKTQSTGADPATTSKQPRTMAASTARCARAACDPARAADSPASWSEDADDNVELHEPAALRALAHPARLTVVDELYQGQERTASELATLTGLTPSAMSYHLRALERWGIVERADERDDARERPWRAAGRSLSVISDASPTATAARDVIVGGYLEHLRDELRRWSLVEGRESEGWRNVAGGRRSFLWLTEGEAQAFTEEMRTVIDRYVGDRDATNHPADTKRLVCVVAVVPEAAWD